MGEILAPVSSKDTGARLIAAGAGELYMGFHDDAWEQRFGANAQLNRMSGFGQVANKMSFQELVEEGAMLASLTTREGKAPWLYCVFNATNYSVEQSDYISTTYLPALAKAGFHGIICTEPVLCQAANALGLCVVASVISAVYNEDLARYYRDAGMARAILPRDLSPADMQAIMNAVPQLEYEVFFMRNGCPYADSHCLGLHWPDRPALCRDLRTSPCYSQMSSFGCETSCGTWDQHVGNHRAHSDRFHLSTCGMCTLWDFERMGVSAYKVVGRSDGIDDLLKDVTLSWQNLQLARQCGTRDEYFARMHRPDGLLELCRNAGMSCYYPDLSQPE